MLEEKYQIPFSYDYTKPFAPPPALEYILFAAAREVIRYQPSGEQNLISFLLEYFLELKKQRHAEGDSQIEEEDENLEDDETKYPVHPDPIVQKKKEIERENQRVARQEALLDRYMPHKFLLKQSALAETKQKEWDRKQKLKARH
jgi:hypothetical protein